MEKDKVYFAKEGLTSTSCNYAANLSKEYCQTIQEELDSISFVNSEIALVGSDFTSTSKGVTDIETLNDKLDKIAKCNSLIAWLREAIKAKDSLKREINDTSLEEWCRDNLKDCPVYPEKKEPVTKDDVLAKWNIKDRNHYLALGAKVSVYGKFLHPNGTYSNARKELKKRVNEPVIYTESGRDTIIKKYEPSIEVSTVDDKFFKLQGIWRKAQAELNGYEHKIQLVIDQDTNEKNSKYAKDCEIYQRTIETLTSEFKAWKDLELQRIANLKVVIPNDLVDIYNEVISLSK